MAQNEIVAGLPLGSRVASSSSDRPVDRARCSWAKANRCRPAEARRFSHTMYRLRRPGGVMVNPFL